MYLSVDGTPRALKFESYRKSPVSAGWTEHFGYAGPTVGARMWVHDTNPIQLLDIFNARNDGSRIVVGIEDMGAFVDLYPGTGFATMIGLPAPIYTLLQGTPSPVFGDLVNGQGSKYPDAIATGGQGSPRNKFVPGFLETHLEQAPWHAALYTVFQYARPLQRIPSEWTKGDAFGFNVYSFHEDQFSTSSASGKISANEYNGDPIPGAKYWELQKFQTWSTKHGYLQSAIGRYTQTHFTISELAAIYLRWRDPRAYDQARRAFLGFHNWAWQCAPGVGTWNYGDISRVKGRCLESCYWMITIARAANDVETETLAWDLANRHAERMIYIRSENIAKGFVLPSATGAQADHLMEPYDCSYFIGVLLWGAALMARLGGEKKDLYRSLADHCATSLETYFLINGKFALDVPATGDVSRAKLYSKFDGGTISWPIYGGYALGLVGKSDYFTELEAGVRAAGYGIDDPFAPGAPMHSL